MSKEIMKSTVIKLNDIRPFIKGNVALQIAEKWAPRLYIQGPAGCGKSYIIRDICAENGWALKTFFVSNSAIEMLTGLPCKVEKGDGAAWTKPEILDMSMDKLEYIPKNYVPGETPTVLLLDDFHLCDRMMQKYMFQLFTEMGLNGYKLLKNTAIIIAGNRAQDKAGAMPIPAPVCNRMLFVEVASESEDWIKNFAISHNVRGDIITFIHNKGDVFLTQEPLESAAWASPRAWTYLSAQMDAYEKACGQLDLHTLMTMASGLIGDTYAKEFVAYRELFAKWNFAELIKENFADVCKRYKEECSKNPTAIYAIITAAVTWLVGVYKKAEYDSKDEKVTEAAKFTYETMAYILSLKLKNVTTAPLVASGTKYIYTYQSTFDKNESTNNAASLAKLLLNNMKQKRDIDWIFYEMFATMFKLKLDENELKSINKAKDNLAVA